MKIGDVEKLIKSKKLDFFRVSNAVKHKIESRNLEIDYVKSQLKEVDYDAIVKQQENHYLIAIPYDKIHDLVIAIRIHGEHINIKTAFIQRKSRRIKGKWR